MAVTTKKTHSRFKRAKTDPAHAFIRSISSPWLHAELVPIEQKWSPDNGTEVTYGVRPNQLLANIEGKPLRPRLHRQLSNYKLNDHFQGKRTLYYLSDSNPRNEFVLLMVDIDVMKSKGLGSTRGAVEFAQKLARQFPGLYYEPSTGGKGIHGYILVEKLGMDAAEVNKLAKRLQTWLRHIAEVTKADIEIVEVKGTCPEFSFDQGVVSNAKSGQYAKVPRLVQHFDRWAGCTLTAKELASSRFDVPEPAKSPKKTKVVRSEMPGSVSGCIVPRNAIERLPQVVKLFASQLVNSSCPTMAGRWTVTAEDVAIFVMVTKYCKNPDESMPTRRILKLWDALYANGDIGRASNAHRLKVIRDWLSEMGHIAWLDNAYDYNPLNAGKGQACRWSVSEAVSSVFEARGITSFVDTDLFAQGPGKNLRPVWRDLRSETNKSMMEAFFKLFEDADAALAA